MARITLRQLLDHAAEHGYGVPAFNINNMEQGLAIMDAAAAVDAPVIIQASRGARSYAQDIMLSKMIDALEEMYPQIPLCMHQDHGNEEATCATAIQHGFTSVMMDGSLKADAKTAADYDYNVDITRRVVEMAHWIGASVEGELGVLGSLEHGGGEQEDGHGVEGKVSHDQLLTDPDQAVDFVRATKVDALAIAMGTSHGAYKFSRQPDGDILAMKVVEEIHRRLPNTHLVMHGSSSVPQPLQDTFNQFGGEMPQTWGVPVEEIVRGIRHGVRNSIRASSLNPRWTRCATSAVSVSSNSVRPATRRRSRSFRWPKWQNAIARERSTRASEPWPPPPNDESQSGSTGHTIEEKSHE